MQANPLWPVRDRFPRLENDTTTDIVVVGGGVAGLSCAYFLDLAGYDVLIIEKEEVGSAATGASSGILYYGSGSNFVEATELYGRDAATILWRETEKTINEIVSLIEGERIECGMRHTGAVMIAKNADEIKVLESERSELESLGIKCRLYNSNELKDFFTARDFLAGISFDICAQIRPAQFAAGIARRFNLPVFEYTPLEKFEQHDDKIVVDTPKAKVSCSKLIVATNLEPFMGLEKHYAVESSVIVASQACPDEKLKQVWPQEKLIWGMEDYYDIIYPQGGRLVLEVYRPKDIDKKLAYYYQGIDFKKDAQWGDSWSKTKDGLPIIGEVRPNVYAAVAMGDQGIVMGFTAGRKMRSALEKKPDAILALTSPNRFRA